MPQPTRAKRKEHRIQSPDHLNWSSNSGSPTSRLPSLRYITFPHLGLPICKMRAHLVPWEDCHDVHGSKPLPPHNCSGGFL